jgi:hypothetical protein
MRGRKVASKRHRESLKGRFEEGRRNDLYRTARNVEVAA